MTCGVATPSSLVRQGRWLHAEDTEPGIGWHVLTVLLEPEPAGGWRVERLHSLLLLVTPILQEENTSQHILSGGLSREWLGW